MSIWVSIEFEWQSNSSESNLSVTQIWVTIKFERHSSLNFTWIRVTIKSKWHSNSSDTQIWVSLEFDCHSNSSEIEIRVTLKFQWHSNSSVTQIWETLKLDCLSNSTNNSIDTHFALPCGLHSSLGYVWYKLKMPTCYNWSIQSTSRKSYFLAIQWVQDLYGLATLHFGDTFYAQVQHLHVSNCLGSIFRYSHFYASSRAALNFTFTKSAVLQDERRKFLPAQQKVNRENH
jgi:hypothetical protein